MSEEDPYGRYWQKSWETECGNKFHAGWCRHKVTGRVYLLRGGVTDSEEWAQARERDIIADLKEMERTRPMSVWGGFPSKPVVGLDIDGTLGDYHGHFLWFATQWFGRSFPPPDEINPGLRLWEFMAIPQHEYRECKLAFRQGGLKRFMPVYPFASELTSRIRKAGAEVWICTPRPYLRLDNIDPDTREWLRRNNIAYDGVIWEKLDGTSKYEYLIKQVGLRRIIAVADDLREQTADAQRLGIHTIYLRDQPYNRDATVAGFRVKDLSELWLAIEVNIGMWDDGR